MMKKFFATIMVSALLFIGSVSQCFAADCWYYTDSSGNQSYVVYESVVYGVRTSFYAKARVKHVNSNGKLIDTQHLEFNNDEGDWWYGRVGVRGDGRRVYDDARATALLKWLQAHASEAHRTGNMTEKVLGN